MYKTHGNWNAQNELRRRSEEANVSNEDEPAITDQVRRSRPLSEEEWGEVRRGVPIVRKRRDEIEGLNLPHVTNDQEGAYTEIDQAA